MRAMTMGNGVFCSARSRAAAVISAALLDARDLAMALVHLLCAVLQLPAGAAAAAGKVEARVAKPDCTRADACCKHMRVSKRENKAGVPV